MDPLDLTSLLACSDKVLSGWDWERCWCGWRLYVLFPLATVGLWLLCMNVGFLRISLPPDGKARLWPRQAFWRWVGVWVFLTTAAFVGIFAGLSSELYHKPATWFPSTATWLNYMAPSIAILVGGLVGLGLCWLIGSFSRPRKAAAKPVPASSVAQP